MVTKPTGRPRGRPPKPKAEKKPRGRPALNWRNDPDRYAIAFAEALTALGHSERESAIFLAAFVVGNVIDAPSEVSNPCPIGATPIAFGPAIERPDGVVLNTQAGARVSTFQNRADYYRQKARRFRSDPDAEMWLYNLKCAFALCLRPRFEIVDARRMALQFAALAGETHYCIDTILPMLDLAYGSSAVPE